MCIHCLGHFSHLPPSPPSSHLPPSVPGTSYSAYVTNFVEEKTQHNKEGKTFLLVKLYRNIPSIAFVYTSVMTHVDSSLTDLYTGYWSPSHDNLCHFRVSVLVPLECGHQTLSCFGFSTYSYISHMCSPLVMWSKSNHTAAFALDLKSTYEREHTIFGLLSLADLAQNDVLQFHPFTSKW
jgi:hypothetical protein